MNSINSIAKNTIMLYFRMIISTLVSLITARYTLQILGAEDFGIYNVVGGIIGFMSVITGTMTSATQRFLAYELGTNNTGAYTRTFSMLINVFVFLCIAIFLVFEACGNLFLDELVIPAERGRAAFWIYQFSIVSFIMCTLSIPYQSAIIAYEKMGIFAYLTFFDVFSKLLLLFVLFLIPYDKLISYAVVMLFSVAVTNTLYYLYCKYKLDGCCYTFCWDKKFFTELSKYTGWNLFGSLSVVLNNQGQSIILNVFFGPVVNAAKAIADRINSIVTSFSANFYMAVSPQIIKSYAIGDLDNMKKLVIKSSRLSFYLMMVLAIPLIFVMPQLLSIWLGAEIITLEMVRFSQLILVYSLIVVFENPITMTIRATGNIKKYQLYIGIITLSFLPLCYVLFLLKLPAYYSMVLLSGVYLFAQIVRVYIAAPILGISVYKYLRMVLIPSLSLAIIAFFLSYMISSLLPSDGLTNLFIKLFLSFMVTANLAYFIGLTSTERKFVLDLIFKHIRNILCKQR